MIFRYIDLDPRNQIRPGQGDVTEALPHDFHTSLPKKVIRKSYSAWVGQRLARFRVPTKIVFCEDLLPRNANGKILKKDLRKLFEESVPG